FFLRGPRVVSGAGEPYCQNRPLCRDGSTMRRTHLAALLGMLAFAGAWWLFPRAGAEGTVEDARGPVAGAVVRVRAGRILGVSDGCGRLALPPLGERVERLTAWKPGYAIGSAGRDRLPVKIELVPLPVEDNDAYAWVAPTPDLRQPLNCGNCH